MLVQSPIETPNAVRAVGTNFDALLDVLDVSPVDQGPFGSSCAGMALATGVSTGCWRLEVAALGHYFITRCSNGAAVVLPNTLFSTLRRLRFHKISALASLAKRLWRPLLDAGVACRRLLHYGLFALFFLKVELMQSSSYDQLNSLPSNGRICYRCFYAFDELEVRARLSVGHWPTLAGAVE